MVDDPKTTEMHIDRDNSGNEGAGAPRTTLTEAEFVARFVAEMLRIVGPTDCAGEPVEPYAREAAPSYYEEQFRLDGMSPEECARTDVSYWEV